MKSVLISIKPKWCEMIASGKKTVEVRKTRPKLDTPFKCYIYCTKSKEVLLDVIKDSDYVWGETYHGKTQFIKSEEDSACVMWGKRQKVIGEFVCEHIDKMVHCGSCNNDIKLGFEDDLYYTEIAEEYFQKCKLTYSDLEKYSNGGDLYGWHISDLVIYDKPKELEEYYAWKKCNSCQTSEDCKVPATITRPPQSWCYVEEAIK